MSENNNEPVKEKNIASTLKQWGAFFATFAMVSLTVLAFARGEYLHENHKEYDTRAENKPITEIYVTAIDQAYAKCNGQYGAERNDICERFQDIISSKIGAADLVAQRSMATSTKGLLRVAIDQMILTAITALLLVATVVVSIWVLHEARKTTKQASLATVATNENAKIAKKTFSHSRRAIEQEFRAYIVLIEDSVVLKFDDGEFRKNLEISFDVRNIGKTAARGITQPIVTKAIVKELVGNERLIFQYKPIVDPLPRIHVIRPYLAPTDKAHLWTNRIVSKNGRDNGQTSSLVVVKGYFFVSDISTKKRKVHRIDFEFRKNEFNGRFLFTSYEKFKIPRDQQY